MPPPKKTLAHNIKAVCEELRARHAHTVEHLANMHFALHDMHLSVGSSWRPAVEQVLRLHHGVQLLCDHVVELDNDAGAVTQHALQHIVRDAVSEATHLCEAHYLQTPPVRIIMTDDIGITCVRPWLQFCVVELLKNALAHSVEHYSGDEKNDLCNDDDNSDKGQLLPFGHVLVHDNEHNVTIEIIDQAGGYDEQLAPSFWFAAIHKLWDRLDDQQSYATVRSPLQGLGVGLLLSRLTMQHFGGTVTLSNHVGQVPALPNDVEQLHPGCLATIVVPKDLTQPERLV